MSRLFALVALLVALQLGPALPSADAAEPFQIVIDAFMFQSAEVKIPAGTEVVWVNKDDEPHTVVSAGENRLFKSPPLDTGDSFTFKFVTPGTYKYFCSIHPYMTATIVVE